MRAIHLTGVSEDYDVLQLATPEKPTIDNPTDVIIQNKYAGVNAFETYYRKGFNPIDFPYTYGQEGLGVVVEIGKDVTRFSVGDNVAYIAPGTFSEYTKIDESLVTVTKLKGNLSEKEWEIYGLILIQGITAVTLVEEAHEVLSNQTILVWAAAGGVGLLLVQLCTIRGAKVFGIALTQEKLDYIRKLGAVEGINHRSENVSDRVFQLTGGKGCEAVYDAVGEATYKVLFDLVARKGSFVSYGNDLGPVPPVTLKTLSAKNIKILRPLFWGYVETQPEWDYYSNKLIELVETDKVKFTISKVYDFDDAIEAIKDLDSSKTTGKLVIRI